MNIRLLIIVIAVPLFIISAAANIYVKLRLKPKDSDLDDYYWEFEDRHPQYAKYNKYSQITFTAVVISMLLLFLGLVL